MSKPLKLALIGADEPIGEALSRVLEARDLELDEFWPISLDPEEAATITFDGREMACLDADNVEWSRINVVVSASPGAEADGLIREAARRGIAVLAARSASGTAPLEAVPHIPSAPVHAVARLITPLADQSGLASLHVFIGLPMVALGNAGVSELANQSRALFALEPAEPSVLPVRIAFNLLPLSSGAGLEREAEIAADLRGALGRYDAAIQVSAVWLPIFHGGVVSLQARTRIPVSSEALRALWQEVPGLIVMDEPMPGGVPTPATEAVDSDDVFVGRVEVQPNDGTRFSCWLCYDQPRLEAARMADWLELWRVETD